MPSPEELARIEIDRLLTAAGWAVQDYRQVDLHASLGVAVREFPLNPGHGELSPSRQASECYEPAYRNVRWFLNCVS